MWNQWLLKSGRGTTPVDDQTVRGPAPPAAVAAAAKIALSALGGTSHVALCDRSSHKLMTERPPIDAARTSLLESSVTGGMAIPEFADGLNGNIDEWLDHEWQKDLSVAAATPAASVIDPLDNVERRNRNLQWLRTHLKSLNEVGKLPFNNADLWQLHQYYFSPPYAADLDPDNTSNDSAEHHEESEPESAEAAEPNLPCSVLSPPKASASMGRAVSFQALGDAFAASGLMPQSCHKRRSNEDAGDSYPAAKRAKSLSKPRVAYYPKIMVRLPLIPLDCH
jgi:hypothetical protein